MPKFTGTPELALGPRPPDTTLTRWLYDELRRAMLTGRLKRGMRLPATRDFAGQHGISRRVVVNVFEQLRTEGYLVSRVGSGTRVSDQLPEDLLQFAPAQSTGRRAASSSIRPEGDAPGAPAAADRACPIRIPHGVVGADRGTQAAARFSLSPRGRERCRDTSPLREAIADYLGTSRGVDCTADEVVIVSGGQQGLDLLARFLVKRGDSVWIEDPAYHGAAAAFRNAGARLVPVPVDGDGLDPAKALRACPQPRAVYVTPAHQFPLGMTMSLERRLALLAAARRSGAQVIEDDYDSEFRFSGRPVPALRGLDRSGAVILAGSFNKVLFPSLRLGYLVLPQSLMDRFLAFRYQADAYPPAHLEAVLCDFIVRRALRAALAPHAGTVWRPAGRAAGQRHTLSERRRGIARYPGGHQFACLSRQRNEVERRGGARGRVRGGSAQHRSLRFAAARYSGCSDRVRRVYRRGDPQSRDCARPGIREINARS